MLTEFRDTAIEGIDYSLRAGGIIGAAFGAIVFSLTDGVLMLVAEFVHGRIDSLDLLSVTSDPNSVPVSAITGRPTGTSNIGLFTNAVVNSPVSPLVCFSSSRALTV